jgi:organic hydroperoxide reductase OsmC/OhrA
MISSVRRYAERHAWPIRGMQARLGATEAQGRITGIEAELVLDATVDDAQLAQLHTVAETCRISRALNVPVALRLTRA